MFSRNALLCVFLLVASSAIAQGELPPNTVPCDQFVKNADGSWSPTAVVTFDIGSSTNLTFGDSKVTPNGYILGGVNLYELLEKKCGRS